MLEHPVAMIVSFVIFVVIGIVIEKIYLGMIDAEYCRKEFMEMASDEIESKIAKLVKFVVKYGSIAGAVLGFCVSILFFILGIFEFHFNWWLLLKILGPMILGAVLVIIAALIFVDSYCVKHFGRTLAFIDMSNSASEVRKTLCKGTTLPFDDKSMKYGDRYLSKLGKKLNSAIARTLWSCRLLGMLLGFAAGVLIVFLKTENIFLLILAGVVGEAAGIAISELLGKLYCARHFGHLAAYYQLHVDIFSIREQIEKGGIELDGERKDLSNSEIAYAEQTEKLREEKLKSITLKEGYQFASIPSRIFAEKTDVPGSYCCPYCYAEVSSDVSSMCANCGKSLGVEAAVVPAPAPQVQSIVNETFEKSTEAPAASSVVEKKSVLKNKKVLIGAGIGAAAIAVVVLVLIANYGPSNSEYNRLAEKLERLEKEAAEKAVSDNAQTNVSSNVSDSMSDSMPLDVQDEYDGLAVGMVLRSDSNLRLRSSENTDSSIITTMNAHTKVKILRIGRADESEGVESNWVLVEILPGGKDRDGKRIPDGTAGWCFGGFLEPCPED
ncbi:MAG: SH3 domain-containing protein [Treponema sp.]|nr:SH3 domain-containing protein [Treponema sp.]